MSQAIDICRSAEATASQLRELGEESRDSVHGVRPKPRRSDERKKDVRKESHKRWETTIPCKFCGKKHKKMKEEYVSRIRKEVQQMPQNESFCMLLQHEVYPNS